MFVLLVHLSKNYSKIRLYGSEVWSLRRISFGPIALYLDCIHCQRFKTQNSKSYSVSETATWGLDFSRRWPRRWLSYWMWRSVIWQVDINVSEKPPASKFRLGLSCRWRQQVPPKLCYVNTELHDVISHETVIFIILSRSAERTKRHVLFVRPIRQSCYRWILALSNGPYITDVSLMYFTWRQRETQSPESRNFQNYIFHIADNVWSRG
jgi:hypothetical protein